MKQKWLQNKKICSLPPFDLRNSPDLRCFATGPLRSPHTRQGTVYVASSSLWKPKSASGSDNHHDSCIDCSCTGFLTTSSPLTGTNASRQRCAPRVSYFERAFPRVSIPSKHEDLPIVRVHPVHPLMRANLSDRETIYRKQHASFPMLYDPEKALTSHFHSTRAQILQIKRRAPIRINIISPPPLCGE